VVLSKTADVLPWMLDRIAAKQSEHDSGAHQHPRQHIQTEAR